MRVTRDILIIAALAAILPSASARAAQSYDNCTGFIDSLPATISAQGTWCLRDDLSTAMTSGNAVTVATNNVTIDCNDFKLGGLAAGDSSLANGIRATNRQNITVRHCNIRGFNHGVRIDGAAGGGHLVEDNRLDNNLMKGIVVEGDNNRVQRNRVYDTGGFPLVATGTAYGIDAAADVIDNTVAGTFGTGPAGYSRGIWVDAPGAEIRNNLVRGMTASGTGTAGALQSNARGITIANNRAYADPATNASFGIIGGGLETFCVGNTATGFATNYTGCDYGLDNLSPP
jgi:hypothetical protein